MATPTTKEIERRLLDYGEARKAMQRIGKAAARNVYDWLTVGKAMVDAREEVFEILGTNRDDTLAYRREFGTVLKREKLHDEDPNGPDKKTRGFLIKIMEREAEVMRWHAKLPKKERLAWNHPTSIWRHFDKWQKKTAAKELTSLTTGLAAAEEAEVVEDAQVRALQPRDAKIDSLRETVRELHVTIDKLNADAVRLRMMISFLLKRLGFEVSELPSDDEIAKVAKAAETAEVAVSGLTDAQVAEVFGELFAVRDGE